MSAAAIHKIEQNGMVPTITTLLKIAGALGRPVAYFVDEEGPAAARRCSPGRRPAAASCTSHQGIDLAGISGPYGRFFLAGAIATVEPGASSGDKPMEHPGEELVYCSTASSSSTSTAALLPDPGDSLHLRTDRPHRWRNPGTKDAVALWMALRPLRPSRRPPRSRPPGQAAAGSRSAR